MHMKRSTFLANMAAFVAVPFIGKIFDRISPQPDQSEILKSLSDHHAAMVAYREFRLTDRSMIVSLDWQQYRPTLGQIVLCENEAVGYVESIEVVSALEIKVTLLSISSMLSKIRNLYQGTKPGMTIVFFSPVTQQS